MPTNETLEATYNVSYIEEVLMKPLHSGKRNFREATEIAVRGLKQYPIVQVYDDNKLTIGTDRDAVTLLSQPSHPRYQEHLKIKEEVEKAWIERHNQYR